MNRRFRMSMFAVLLGCSVALGAKGVSAYSRERAAWAELHRRGSVASFWQYWRPWIITRGKRVRTGCIS